jgi:aminoglycoside phosphotransferase family enzyme/predicted kinase
MSAPRDTSSQHALPRRLQGLLTPAAYPHAVDSIELVQTHISWVFLTGPYAYKIKRPVRYPFVDLRSAERRAFLCHEELRLNRRFAPELYLEVCAITSGKEGARLGGPGEVIEHAVRMVQFCREDELDRLLAAGRIEPGVLEAFGKSLARIHDQLPAAPAGAQWGRAGQVRSVVLENFEQCLQSGAAGGGPRRLEALRPLLSDRLDRSAARFEQRRADGRVRECHGDLHARNVVLRDGRLVAFDCLEFAAAFRWIDVADEVAFLLADLKARGRHAHAQAFLGGWLAESGDYAACHVLDLYEAHRALVRAKVTALGPADLTETSESGLDRARREYDAYVGVAEAALAPKRPFIAIVSGLSGSGKTWLASRLAPGLGAVHLRSDVERKRLAGLPESARTSSPVRQGLYAPGVTQRVYAHLAACAEDVASGGYPAIVDATFGRREERARFRELAARLGIPLRLLHCRASPEVLRERVARRHAAGADASEADLEVLRWQQDHAEPPAADEGIAKLDVDTTSSDPVPSSGRLLAWLRAAASGPAPSGATGP